MELKKRICVCSTEDLYMLEDENDKGNFFAYRKLYEGMYA